MKHLGSRLPLPLYVRIWLAVALALALLTLLAGWVASLTADPPPREVVVRNGDGQIVGQGLRRLRPHESPRHDDAPDKPVYESDDMGYPHGHFGSGPEFLVRMDDGTLVHVHLPRPARPYWDRFPIGFFTLLALVGVAVALGTYPIVRRMLRRLELLQKGVEQWGTGNLSARVPVQGHDEVAFLAQRFNHAATQIEQLVVAHKSLLANASHELRSPLTRIRLALELMTQGRASEAQRLEVLRNLDELDQLIGEILLASRLDATEARHTEAWGPNEAVDLIGLAAELAAQHGAELELAGGLQSLEVQGQHRLLHRLLRNLLENAQRYGTGREANEAVQLRLAMEGDAAVLQVADRGPGVPESERERIFEPFYRLRGASEREGGVGLGLALVQSIARRHGGSVRCLPREGGGAVFEVRLPSAA